MAIIGVFLVRQVSEYDVWFHLALGKEILRNGLPATDRFTLLGMGRPLHDSQWLFQVLLTAGYRIAGFWWLEAVQVILWGMAFWFTYRSTRKWTSPLGAWMLLLVTAIACEERFTIRPEIVTYVMVAVFSWRLQQGKYRSWFDIALLAGLQVIWANSHGVFVIGPFLVGCYLVAAIIEGIRGEGYTEACSLGIAAGAVTAGCLMTPYGWKSLQFAWLLFTEVGPKASPVLKSIGEMESPFLASSLSSIAFWCYLTLIILLLVTWLGMLLKQRRELSLARTLVAFALLAISMTARRNLPLFALVAAPLVAENLSLLGTDRLRRICGALAVAVMVTIGLVWSPRPAFQYLRTEIPYRFGVGMSSDYAPLELPAFLDRIGFAGQVFNSHSLGGFYGYYGFPDRIPFYDARLEAVDQQEMHRVFETIDHAQDQPAPWHEFVRHYDIRGLLLEHVSREAAGLLPLVSSDPAWRLVYLDNAASFWLRTDQSRLPPSLVESGVADIATRTTNFAQEENLDVFLDKTGRYPEVRLALLERLSRRYGKSKSVLTELGLLQVRLGRLTEADRTFHKLLASNPKERTTLTTLAQIALMRGDESSAESYLLKALSYYPDDPDLKDNLAKVRAAALR